MSKRVAVSGVNCMVRKYRMGGIHWLGGWISVFRAGIWVSGHSGLKIHTGLGTGIDFFFDFVMCS
jgi:hypothetical protein